jgi:uncharacterized protein (DUF1015 family)
MARVFPFRALRYDSARVSHQQVLTQPYDKITPAMQERYYRQSPYNLIRLELGRTAPTDSPTENVYTRAAAALREWRSEGVLVADPVSSLYIYSQDFSVPGGRESLQRRGFIALGQLEDYSTGIVFRHEQTHTGPKADRLNLLRATRAITGQVFMLYSDPAGEIDSLLQPSGSPATDVQDEYRVRHRMWPVCDSETLAAVQRLMSDKRLIIADGHHRYETALAYRDECRAAGRNGAGERLMMTFVNMDSPGLVILPTHRVLRGLPGFNADRFLNTAAQFFAVESLPPSADPATVALREAGAHGTTILAATASGQYLLRARPADSDRFLADLSPQQRLLDVVQLHRVLLQHVLGISEHDIRELKHIEYLRDPAEALIRVREGADLAFLMNPVRIAQLRDVAFSGQVMPQKSTDFYPKMLSGIAIYALD